MADKDLSREESVPPPKCKAILLCERTITEAGTGQVSLIGLFDSLEVPAVPSEIGPFTIYLLLTDGIVNHEYEISVEIHHLDSDTVVGRAVGLTLKWIDRLAKRDMAVVVSPQIDQAGSYDVVVFADNQEVDRHRFAVAVAQSPDNQQGENDD